MQSVEATTATEPVRFSLRQQVSAPRDQVLAAFCDARFYEELGTTPDLGVREVVDCRQAGDEVTLSVRFAYTGEVSAAVRALVDPAHLTWVTVTTVQRDQFRATFTIVPDHHAGWLEASGRYDFEVSAGDAARTLERMEGEVRVRVPLMGRAAEKGLVGGFTRFVSEQARRLETWAPPAGW